MSQRANLPAQLLVPYVAAGAAEVLESGRPGDRSVWAITDAKRQLREQRDALLGHEQAVDQAVATSALMASSPAESLDFSALVLERVIDSPAVDSVEARETESAQALDRLIQDLERLLDGDSAAADRTRTIYGQIVATIAA